MKTNLIYSIDEIVWHERADLAICKTSVNTSPHRGTDYQTIMNGTDVEACGLLLKGKSDQHIDLNFRFQKGYVCSIAPEDTLIRSLSRVYELSFPVLQGFSGAPLIKGDRIVGMVYNNRTTEILEFQYHEFKENGKEILDRLSRIHELGLAHPIEEIVTWIRSKGVKAFE
jgi:hypothetical protein